MSVDELDKYRAPALDKGLDILELLAQTDEGLTQIEIAKALGRTPNEIYRMLDRLVRRAYVRRMSGDRYELTLKLFELAHQRPPMHRLVSQAIPVLRRFARECEQACHLVVYDRNALVVVAQVDSPTYWNVSLRVGSRLSMVNTGSGHVFLAFSSAEERAMMLDDPSTRTREKLTPALKTRLAAVNEQGFEIMPSFQVAGVTNVSAPVFGPLGSVIAALTCPYTERLDRKDAYDMKSVLTRVIASAGEISQRQLGDPA